MIKNTAFTALILLLLFPRVVRSENPTAPGPILGIHRIEIVKAIDRQKVQYILNLDLKVNAKEREIYFDNYPNHHAIYISINGKAYELLQHRKIRTVFHERFIEKIGMGKSLIIRTGGPINNYTTEDVESIRIRLVCPDKQHIEKITAIKERVARFSVLWTGTLETEEMNIKAKEASNKAL